MSSGELIQYQTGGVMYSRIALAYNESLEAQRALVPAIELAKTLGAELHTVTVMAGLPAYTAYVAAVYASLSRVHTDDRVKLNEALHGESTSLDRRQGIELTCHLIEGGEVDAIVTFVRQVMSTRRPLSIFRTYHASASIPDAANQPAPSTSDAESQ
jgi:nucleotide-binding universal stress UspA family protein